MAETFLQALQRKKRTPEQAGAEGFDASGFAQLATPQEPQQQPAQKAPAQQQPAQATGAAQPTATAAAGPTAASGANNAAPPMAAYSSGAAPAGNAATTAKPAMQPATQAAAQPATNPQQQAGEFNTWARATFGRDATPAEFQAIQGKIGAPQGPNGSYSPAQLEAAKAEAQTMARAMGWTPGAPAAPAAPVYNQNSGVDPNVAGNVGHQGRVGVEPGQGYTAGQLSPYQQANTGQVGQLNTALTENILRNPESLPPALIEQMKAAGKASAASQAGQLRQQAATALAGRGFSGAGGMSAGADAAVDRNFLETLLNSNRDVEIGAAQTNFANRLQAQQAGTEFENAATNRNVANSGAEVQRFGANEGARQAESADDLGRDLFRAGQMNTDREANLREWVSRQGVNLDTNKFEETRKQFRATFGLDIAQFLEQTRQYSQNFGEGTRQFNVGAGLSTAGLQQQANNSMLEWLKANGL